MTVEVIVGLQRGDEGKGRFVDMLADSHDIVARFNGGSNAGHTVVLPNGQELDFHQVPSGIAHQNTMNVIGNGTLVNPIKLVEEINNIQANDIDVSTENLMISSAAHLILPHHIFDDVIRESGDGSQGTTKSGIAQVAAQKSMRAGARVEMINNDPDILLELVYSGLIGQRGLREKFGLESINERQIANEYIEQAKIIGKYITDTVIYINQQLRKDKPARVLAEGAQAFLLDIDHGMYPFATSSSTTSGGACIGLGIAPSFIDHVFGVAKAVQSHVGGGPFVTEITDKKILEQLHGDLTSVDAETGTTTGRIRRLGYLDLPQIRRSQMVNGKEDEQSMALTKLDWVPRYGNEVNICVAYSRKGKKINIAPDAAYKLDQSEPIYEVMPTWTEDISEVREFDNLPSNAKSYIEFIEDETKIPIKLIGVGPRRDQVIERS